MSICIKFSYLPTKLFKLLELLCVIVRKVCYRGIVAILRFAAVSKTGKINTVLCDGFHWANSKKINTMFRNFCWTLDSPSLSGNDVFMLREACKKVANVD